MWHGQWHQTLTRLLQLVHPLIKKNMQRNINITMQFVVDTFEILCFTLDFNSLRNSKHKKAFKE